MHTTKSKTLMARSQNIFPGGVNSPVRSFASVGGSPIVFSHGQGRFLYDVDGNCFLDFCSSWGPLILGHSQPNVLRAVENQLAKAMTFGAPSEPELLLAEKMREFLPQLEMLRFVSSGTEATMSAMRVARAATDRAKFLKFEGCYHGHADQFLVKAGSGLATLGTSSSAGVPSGMVQDTLIAPYNDIDAVQRLFIQEGNSIAAIIVEPVAANMGLVLPRPGFLECLREVTRMHGALLIFDEVMTGYRLARGGCAEVFGIEPDLWTFGKIIGGGLPAAAYGGRKDVMGHVSPLGKAYQAGTLSGNPLAMAAGYATLCELEKQDAFALLEEKGKFLDHQVDCRLGNLINENRLCYVRQGSFFCFFFGKGKPPQNLQEVSACDMNAFNRVYHAWLENGIYLGPSGYEVGFLSTCLENEDLEKLVAVVQKTLLA